MTIDTAGNTCFSKSTRNGWNALTIIELGACKSRWNGDEEGTRQLRISTGKASRSGIYTSATCAFSRQGATTFAIGGDFSKTVARNSEVKCTEKSVRAQHATVLVEIDALVAEATAFYAPKEAPAPAEQAKADPWPTDEALQQA